MDFEKFANSEWWLYGLAIFNVLALTGFLLVSVYKKVKRSDRK